MGERQFRTAEYRRDASRTFGRMSRTTLRVTGLEPVFGKANAQNEFALRSVLGDLARVETIVRNSGGNPQVMWNEVKKAGAKDHEKAVRMIGMSLGNPNAYPDFPPNPTLMECMRKSMGAANDRASCSYTATSYGIPQLMEYLKGANLSDPASVRKDSGKFQDVKVLITAGGSQAAHYGLAPAILRPEHAVAVHDWIYIIHLGAAYYRNAELRNFELRSDGVPDPASLQKVLEQNASNGTEIRCVVTTTIGNPIGSATPREVVVEIMDVVRRQSKKEGRPIIAFFDTAYETFRPDGKPLDPIEIAIDEKMEIPVGVFETASKGHGLCGLRLGALRMLWPESFHPETREDYFACLDNIVQPTLGLVPNPIQAGLLEYLMKIETDERALGTDTEYMDGRRESANANLMKIAGALRQIDGIYLARYYDHSGEIAHIDPNTLASFYIGFGFHGLTKFGAKFNQAKWLAEFSLENGLPVINCVPGISFLPQERWPHHPALIRITALTNKDDTDAFLKTVAAAADKL